MNLLLYGGGWQTNKRGRGCARIGARRGWLEILAYFENKGFIEGAPKVLMALRRRCGRCLPGVVAERGRHQFHGVVSTYDFGGPGPHNRAKKLRVRVTGLTRDDVVPSSVPGENA